MKKRRKLDWDDIKKIVEFKTFYLMIVLTLSGVLFIFLEAWIFSGYSQSHFKGIFSAIGITLITSSTISFIIEIFLRLDIVDFMVSRMLLVLPNELKNNAGVTEFYEDRKVINFDNLWNESSGFLKIIGLSCNDILAPSRMPLLMNKVKNNPKLSIHILLINPWSLMAARRSEANVYGTKHECVKRVYSVLVELKDVLENLRQSGVSISNVDVRVYDDIPSLSMIIDDKEAVVTPLTPVAQGGSSPFFIAKNILTDNCVYNLYLEHFNCIWEKSTSILNNEYEKLFTETLNIEYSRITALPKGINEWLRKIYTTSS